MDVVRMALLAFGYPVAIVVITRFVPVVRERRLRWLVVHHMGVTAIVSGWAISGDRSAVAVNAAWLVASSLWYALGRHR
jgi:hypothetical protein